MNSIRQATIDDLEIIVKMRIAFFEEMKNNPNIKDDSHFVQKTREYFNKKLGNKDIIIWLIERESFVVSTGGLILFEGAPTLKNVNGLEGYIFNMFTVSKYRRQGLSQIIINEIISYAKFNHISRLWLKSTKDGFSGYLKNGFTLINGELDENPHMELIF
ncbi:MAG: GNAT family N-acetyltransferase [Candidatus Riflebacteria bacterium]|nr:GNAT family N-acetyltransferase [Candidatus Riflebacteria bacterium]